MSNNYLGYIMIEETLDYINEYTDNFEPEIGIVLGSGLGDLADKYCDIAIPYSNIPHFAKSTVQGHKGQLVFADINGRKVVMMQGRNHFYEGHSMSDVTYPIKVMKKLGVKTLILTNAAGAVNKSFRPADLMVITDHINFMGTNPLIGRNDENFGVRFPDMSEVYSKNLIKIVDAAGRLLKLDLKHGVYMATTGPSYETPAEIKMARFMGADAIGMSTVPEAIVANYCGIEVIGISCISNYATGVSTKKLSHEEVIETTDKVKAKFKELVLLLLKNI
ncbi:purine nucleoside phosphorylase I inosine and guanosine-specific [Fusobacterium sp. CAG:815]|jgi:purine nucleoside phosphorylase I, inosine and guanosine-specific|nr:purine nucleoside phosphorylase I inosine and guanosine-specific [Fusobacterium sp. CAG:815]